MKTSLILNIGGTSRLEGWKNLNIQPGPGVDFVGDCKDLGQFADDSISEIYASHILEHLSYVDELVAVLRGVHRVLEPDILLRRVRCALPALLINQVISMAYWVICVVGGCVNSGAEGLWALKLRCILLKSCCGTCFSRL